MAKKLVELPPPGGTIASGTRTNNAGVKADSTAVAQGASFEKHLGR
jgi:hypothetical protein